MGKSSSWPWELVACAGWLGVGGYVVVRLIYASRKGGFLGNNGNNGKVGDYRSVYIRREGDDKFVFLT